VKIENNKLIEGEKLKAEKVDKKKVTLDAMLEEQNLNEETLREEGDFYYDSTKDQFVLQIKKDIKDASKKEKFNNLKNHSKARTITNAIANDVVIEEVKYSNEELIEIQDQFFKVNNPELFTQNTNLNLDTINNRLELVTDSISDGLKKSLEDTYGDKLYVKVDPSFVDKHEPLKARKDNWNQLGAGIGMKSIIENKLNFCTTAGVARKGTQYFIVTAGHCVGEGGTPAYQWSVPVGTPHLNAMSSGFDFGLVRIDRANELTGGRYATNGYYISGESSSGYDAKVSGAAKPYTGMPVCKSGITTGYTCGEVKHVRALHPVTRLVGIKVESSNAYFASNGDSGAPLTYYSNGIYRTVGVLSASATTIQYSRIVYFTPLEEMLDKYGLTYYSSNTKIKL